MPPKPNTPIRYTYPENLSSNAFKEAAKAGRYLFGVKNPEMSSELSDLHAQSLLKSDSLADQVVTDLFTDEGAGRELYDNVMKNGLDIDEDIPESLRQLYLQVTTDPEWLDRSRLQRAVVVSQRVGRFGMYGLAMLGLLAGYSNSDLTKPLIATGALTGNSTFNRVNFTSAFWMEVTKEGALEVGAHGFDTALFVRLKHALVRRNILAKNSDWNTDQWGIPINTSDSAITNVGFSTMLVLSSKLLGFRISNEEFEDVLHLWRYIGYLLGDDDRLLPKTVEDAVQALGFVAAGNNNQPDEDSVTLANDLLISMQLKGRGKWLEFTGWFKYRFYRAYAEYLIPSEQHKALKLPSSYGLWLLIPLLQTPIIFSIDSFRHYFPFLTPLFQKVARRGQETFIKNRFLIADSKYQSKGSLK